MPHHDTGQSLLERLRDPDYRDHAITDADAFSKVIDDAIEEEGISLTDLACRLKKRHTETDPEHADKIDWKGAVVDWQYGTQFPSQILRTVALSVITQLLEEHQAAGT